MTSFYTCLLYFYIFILYTPCVAPVRITYFLEPSSTPFPYRRFRTLWQPFTQRYKLVFLHQSPKSDIQTTTYKTRTIHVPVDENLRTPYFMKDYYYNDQPDRMRTKILYMKEVAVPVRAIDYQDHLENIFRQNQQSSTSELPPAINLLPSDDDLPPEKNQLTSEKNQQNSTPKPKQVSCYVCGLSETGVPDTMCHDAFDVNQLRFLMHKREYKKHCYTGSQKQDGKKWYGKLYRDGCFKRFLDISTAYTERGCRERKPFVGASFASKRFAALERVLYQKDQGCVFSPYAVLTPFSKAISLYARYHVCVCQGQYCNQATKTTRLEVPFILVITVNLLICF